MTGPIRDRRAAIRLASAAAAHQATSGAGLGAILNIEEGWHRRENVSGEEEERAWAEGQAMTIDQAVAFALSTLANESKT